MFVALVMCGIAVADPVVDSPPGADSGFSETPAEDIEATPEPDAREDASPQAAMTGPVPIFTPPPVYPPDALAAGAGGSVLLSLEIDEEGAVIAVEVLDADRQDFAAAAALNARSFRFSPATLTDGSSVAVTIQYRTVFEAEKAAPISVEGFVREAGPRIPLRGASVMALSAEGERVLTETDDAGGFKMAGLDPGPWTARVSAPGHVTDTFEFTVEPGQVASVTAFLVRDEVRTGQVADQEIVIVAVAPETEVTERRLTREEVRYLPGTGGDVVKVVQNLPGVARSPFGTGNLRIRGTAPEDSLYYLDGGRIPIVFHFAGLTTVLASDFLEEVAYLPGSYTVRYGRALGGLVDLRTERRLPERSSGYASVDVFQASLYVQQVIGNRDAVTVSARRSYADAVLNPILNKGDLTVQAPRYYDVQARWSRKLDSGWTDLLLFVSDDRFRFLGQGEDEVVLAGYATQFQKARWLTNWDLGSGRSLEVSVVMGPEKKFFENDGSSQAYEREARISTRLEYKQEETQTRDIGWLVGTDPNFNRTSFLYDIAGPPERAVSTNRWAPKEEGAENIWQPSIYGEVSARLGAFKLLPGLRADAQITDAATVVSVDPRLRTVWEVSDRTTLKAGGGLHTQAPTSRQLSPSSDGNPDLAAEKAYQYSLGVKQVINPWLDVDLTGFYHHLTDLISGREDRFFFYSGPPPVGPYDTDPYANDGTGRTFGVEFLANVKTETTNGFLSATWSHSDRVKRPGSERTLFPYDQPLVVNALVSQKLPKRWRIGARVRYGSGNPYTPVENRIFNHDRREFIPVYGERDSGRLPPFFSLDLRIDKDYVFKKWTLTTYLDLQNATYAKNVENLGYSYDYREEEPTLSSPPLPAFGLRGEW